MGDLLLKEEKMEELRLEMYNCYNQSENKSEVIEVSQELDKLLYEFIVLSSNNYKHSN